MDKALSIRPEYLDAIVYKGLLLRTQATLVGNYDEAQRLIKQAEGLSAQAEQLRQKQQAGAAPAPTGAQ